MTGIPPFQPSPAQPSPVDSARRSLAGQPRDEILAVLAAGATAAFGLLEPSLGRYLIRAA